VVIALGGYLIAQGKMILADLLTFTLYVNAFLTPIRKLTAFFEQFTNGMAGFKRFIELMRVEPEIVDAPDAVDLSEVNGRIEFRNVSFSYNSGETVLDQLDLEIRPGHTLALVGPSGAGKSTLCQLIPRFYDVTEGGIYLDGRDIRTIRMTALRRNIGIVQQDVFLFAASVRENIRYGKQDATDEEIVRAAKQAEIHDFILSLPRGYDTEVGERGTRLSGGQKQRISIARIFLKNPPVLILDEATSALDTSTELKIQTSLEKLAAGRTCLIIAHRLSTIRTADAIIYIDDEGIRECGRHDELIARDGPYRALYQAQFARLSEAE
jgi:ATP-binding cassette subfamily B protein